MAFANHETSTVLEPVRASYNVLAPTYDKRWHSYIHASLAKVLSILSLNGTYAFSTSPAP